MIKLDDSNPVAFVKSIQSVFSSQEVSSSLSLPINCESVHLYSSRSPNLQSMQRLSRMSLSKGFFFSRMLKTVLVGKQLNPFLNLSTKNLVR